MKIAFIGKLCSGKSYAAKYLKDHYGYEILSFGGPVKKYASEIFNLKHKDRQIIQDFAQLLKKIDKDVWVDYLLRDLENINSQYIVIDDLRFHNEQEALKKKGFIFIKLSIEPELQEERIEKTYLENKNIHLNRRNDISEIYTDELEFDHEIKINKSNENTLTDFIVKIISNIKDNT
tara:strand:- start:488 stop:1018 length:531 start_codon:yes stop_codon:yes gene_type:complete